MRLIGVTLGARRASPLLVVTGLLALAGCGASAPAAPSTPYQQALEVCEDQAEHALKESATSQGHQYTEGDMDYQIIDPCMKAKGLEPPAH